MARDLYGRDLPGRYVADSGSNDVSKEVATPTGSSVGRALEKILGDILNIKDFGVKGDGTTDDTFAIQQAISSGARCIRFPAGTYKVSPQSVMATGWGKCLVVPSDVTLVFDPGAKLECDIDFANRCVVLLVRGSNVLLDGVAIENVYAGAGSPYAIGIGGGSEYDDAPVSMTNITVRRGWFKHNWLSVTFQVDSDSTTITDIVISDCWSYAKPGAASSGNYSIRSDLPVRRIRSVTMRGNRAYHGVTSSAYNAVGCEDVAVIDNYAFENTYAGCEIENGCRYVKVSGNTFYNCSVGAWVDDSSHVTVENNMIHYIDKPAGIAGAIAGIFLSRQGYAEDTNPTLTGLRVRNNHLTGCRINIGTFGASPQGKFGYYEISGNFVDANGVTLSTGATLPSADFRRVSDNTVIDATTSLSISGGTTDKLLMSGNLTSGGTSGLNVVSSITEMTVTGNNFVNGITALPANGTQHSNIAAGTVRETLDAGFRLMRGSGAPEGVVTAGPSALYQCSSTGKIYVKETGTGNTGWVVK